MAGKDDLKPKVDGKAAENQKKIDSVEAQAAQDSFARTFYDKINEVIGGSNPDEKLCLLLPGIALNKKDFEYDYLHNAEKGPVVSANESRLANKLYDPYDLVGADNGKTLDRQYRSALNLLSPRLNAIIVNAKNDLRRFLMTEFPYSFDGGPEQTYTFQEVYFRLYQEYIDAMKAWAEEQSAKKEEITARVKAKWARLAGQGEYEYSEDGFVDDEFVNVVLPDNPEEQAVFIMTETNREINNEYLSWYEINAESRLAEVNKKMSAVLSVFSANDMKVLEGILDCGSGSELQEAREMLNNTRKRNPDGGYVYPVKFSPSNWFEYLDTSFTPVDLLNTPDTYLNELDLCYSRLSALESQIESITSRIPSDDELKESRTNFDKSKASLADAETKLAAAGVDGVASFAKTLVRSVSRLCLTNGASVVADQAKDTLKNLSKSQSEKKGDACDALTKKISEESDAFIDNLCKAGAEVNAAQDKVMASMDEYSKTALDYVTKKNLTQLKNFLEPITIQKKELERQIAMLENKLLLAATSSSKPEGEETYSDDATKPVSSVNPPEVPNGFAQVTIIHKVSKTQEKTSSSSTVTRSHKQKGFWVFKKQNTETHEESSFEQLCQSEGTQIHIGMNIAKVGIERSWFDPGVFTLTKEMFSLGKQDEKISEDKKIDPIFISMGNPGALNKDEIVENLAHCVLPCYPTAMVVARDVTIKVVNTHAASSMIAEMESDSSNTSKGFFVFNGSSSSSTNSEETNSCTFTSDKSVTMKFATPQVIGYYLQYVVKDESAPYPSDSTDLQTIGGFVSSYLKLIEDMKAAKVQK